MSNSAASPMAASSTSMAARGSGKPISFIPELQSMMFALGDSRRPLHETAALVEDIVHTQLINMLHQAAEVALLRGARVISPEDIIFLMRKDKKKLRRLLKYMQFRDYKSKLMKTLDDEEPLDSDKFSSSSANKRQKLVLDFLGSIDQTGEFLTLLEDEEVDEVKQERMERLEKQTRNMDSAQYADFCESRQLSFSKKLSKFREWLDCSSLDLKPNGVSMEILSYLAYETVAQIVDLALLVKQDMTPKTGDPFSHAISATFLQYHSSSAETQPRPLLVWKHKLYSTMDSIVVVVFYLLNLEGPVWRNVRVKLHCTITVVVSADEQLTGVITALDNTNNTHTYCLMDGCIKRIALQTIHKLGFKTG